MHPAFARCHAAEHTPAVFCLTHGESHSQTLFTHRAGLADRSCWSPCASTELALSREEDAAVCAETRSESAPVLHSRLGSATIGMNLLTEKQISHSSRISVSPVRSS